MELEFIKNKVYYKIFDYNYKGSTGIYSKNKYQDATKLKEIQQNIDNIKSDYLTKELVILTQEHGNKVICADNIDYQDQIIGDSCVTTKKSIALSILTADCVPVLFASSDGDVIGAAHCGWRSTKANLVKNIYKEMIRKGAKNIKAIIGPSISQQSYEVDAKYYHNFVTEDNNCKNLFIPSINKNHYMFDLAGYVKQKLEQENIELFLHIEEDTYSMPKKYPSYRRFVHNKERYSSNILSTIMIK